MSALRLPVSYLTFSANALIDLVKDEQYVEVAMIPTKNDRPTIGFGSTFNTDGSPVKLGQRTTPVQALGLVRAHIAKAERLFKSSLEGASLSQVEYDVYLDWVYQYGNTAWDKSSIRRGVLAGDYKAAADALLLYKYSGGFDCSIPGNKVCAGVWTRQLERHRKCMEVQ